MPETYHIAPPPPPRMARRPRDARGRIVPWFAGDTQMPNYKLADSDRIELAVRESACWMCGERLGRHKAFMHGPLMAITRLCSEPSSHRECAEYAAVACPHLAAASGGDGLVRPVGETSGPGVLLIWVTHEFRSYLVNGRPVFEVGLPSDWSWLKAGRAATYYEAEEALRRSYGAHMAESRQLGLTAVSACQHGYRAAQALLPADR